MQRAPRCGYGAVLEHDAVCEAHHVNGTHPKVLKSLGCVNSQVDVWENCARDMTIGVRVKIVVSTLTPNSLTPNSGVVLSTSAYRRAGFPIFIDLRFGQTAVDAGIWTILTIGSATSLC